MKLLQVMCIGAAVAGAAMAAQAESFDISFSGPGVTASGVLNTTPDASDPGAYFVDSGSVTINGSAWTITGGTTAPGTSLTTTPNSNDWDFIYDNVLFVPAPYVDGNGLLFTDGSDTSNLYSSGGVDYFLPSGASLNADTGDGIPVTFAVTPAPTPEPASVVYSGTAALGLAGVMAMELRRRRLAGAVA